MKHSAPTTVLLVSLFLLSQVVGLILVNLSISETTVVDGEVQLEHSETAIGERPPLAGVGSFLYLLFGVLLGTAMFLLLVKFRKFGLWKFWFFFAVFLSMSVALGVLLDHGVAYGIALVFALMKIYRPNPIIHNLTEILMYSGIAVLLVPIFDVFWMLVLLLAISAYDAIAVWKTKHMVSMAEFQAESKVFAGLFIPKRGIPSPQQPKRAKSGKAMMKIPQKKMKKGLSHAILGGGDIAFPLLFAGVVMEGLIKAGVPKVAALYESLWVVLFATMALSALLLLAKRERFYPAMPFLTAGCMLGWLVVLL